MYHIVTLVSRYVAYRNHIPDPILYLFFVFFFSFRSAGYKRFLESRRLFGMLFNSQITIIPVVTLLGAYLQIICQLF